MKVAVIHNTYQQPGGEDVVVAAETRLLQRQGHAVVSYQRSNDDLRRMSKRRQLWAVKDLVHSLDSKREIRELLRREKPDIVHVHNTFMVISPSVYEACQDEGIAVLQTLHNYRLLCPAWSFSRDGRVCEECLDDSLWSGIRHACYRNSHAMTAAIALMLKFHRMRGTWQETVNGYVALTEFARCKFIQGGLPAHKIHVKPNFLGSDPGAKREVGSGGLFVGRLSPEKGVNILLAAWARLKRPLPLVIIGDGPLRETLEKEIVSRRLSNVTLRGWLPREHTVAAMKSAAFLVTPSIWYEGFPMTMVEAFACGTPVICSRLGGMQEIVKDQCTGLHFTPADSADLAAKVESVGAQPEQLFLMGRAARQEYEELYTPEKNYSALMRIYQQTIARCSRQ
jgi:glycosyltransferase involved in cell wall biosynthesis